MTRDQRSQAAAAYRALYNTKEWKRLRAAQLTAHPLCQCPHCQEGRIRTTVATVVDHIKPHRGNRWLFFSPGNVQSMAKRCHDAYKQSEERGGAGFRAGCNANGLPIDPGHHWNTPDRVHIPDSIIWPTGLLPSKPPLIILCGPPGAGKSTLVKGRALPGAIVIDVDDIVTEICGVSRTQDRAIRRRALDERNKRLAALSTSTAPEAWFLTLAAKPDVRARWATMLKPKEVIVLDTPQHICASRIATDQSRAKVISLHLRLLSAWWRDYKPWRGDSPTAPT